MSMPVIRGYLERPDGTTLAELWGKPSSVLPELWPQHELQQMTSVPTGWITVEERFTTEEGRGGRGCVLIERAAGEDVLKQFRWIGGDLGDVSIFDERGFEDGLTAANAGVVSEFFVQVRNPSGAAQRFVEVTYPFLWYWDAFPTANGWKYLNEAGRAQDLIRWEIEEKSWKVEVRALELRQYLAACSRTAVLQVDYLTKLEHHPFDRVDDEFVNAWAHVGFHALHQAASGRRPALSRVWGQYLVAGQRTSRVPRFEERPEDKDYPDFIYGVDPATGEMLRYTCDPDQLGTYFDQDESRPHYLTAVCFRREVLQPYALEPTKYRMDATSLGCLNLWSLSISTNTAGQIEVYLGDLGRDLPSDEWGHWKSHNVAPEGVIEGGRFRRDFLGQWTSSHDPVGDLRRARERASEVSAKILGRPLWRGLDSTLKAEFSSLIGPLSDDNVSLGQPVLVLTRALVDAIDSKALKSIVVAEKDEKSLQLLRKFVTVLGADEDPTEILRALQRYRSKSGIAHFVGSDQARAAADLEIADLTPFDAFASIVSRLTESLDALTVLMELYIERDGSVNADN
ncbi:hypothetical protein [Glycomyces paridis]|uniref:Uncharacterized protein n=1 Tax=Glycomyces paridis TaxID=2126555 RepID=A0A4S8P331_9ACTN|nr:hypothetical protein [Glycomyces paridis]THV22084.1 hypothetical protein E9998_24000 [Glycomyces paridis]